MTMPKFEPVATAMVNQHGTSWMHWNKVIEDCETTLHNSQLHNAAELLDAMKEQS